MVKVIKYCIWYVIYKSSNFFSWLDSRVCNCCCTILSWGSRCCTYCCFCGRCWGLTIRRRHDWSLRLRWLSLGGFGNLGFFILWNHWCWWSNWCHGLICWWILWLNCRSSWSLRLSWRIDCSTCSAWWTKVLNCGFNNIR